MLGDFRRQHFSATAEELRGEIVRNSRAIQLLSADSIKFSYGRPPIKIKPIELRGYVALKLANVVLGATFSAKTAAWNRKEGLIYMLKPELLQRQVTSKSLDDLSAEFSASLHTVLEPPPGPYLVLEDGNFEKAIRKMNEGEDVVRHIIGGS